jgi:predicted Zn-dependent peptidase
VKFHEHQFRNGLTLIGEAMPGTYSTSFGYFVRTGSRDETQPEHGVSHFLEHMLFKGSEKRSAVQVNLDFDRIGADYNATTSEETTCYFGTVLPEQSPRLVVMLTDLLEPSLRDEDFQVEKQVILEEISMYDDQPSSKVWDHAKELYFQSHPLGRTILGTNASIQALTPRQMRSYFERRYTPGNIVAVVTGQFDWDALRDQVGELTSGWQGEAPMRGPYEDPHPAGRRQVFVAPDVSQENLLLLCRGAAADASLRYAGAILALALGDDSGSRLHWELIDTGLAEYAATSVDRAYGTGLLVSSLVCDATQAGKNLEKILAILNEVQQNGITDRELTQARNKVLARIVRGSERPRGRLHALAGSWLYNHEPGDADTHMARYDQVTLGDIRAYLDEYPITEPVITGYGPLTSL